MNMFQSQFSFAIYFCQVVCMCVCMCRHMLVFAHVADKI